MYYIKNNALNADILYIFIYKKNIRKFNQSIIDNLEIEIKLKKKY